MRGMSLYFDEEEVVLLKGSYKLSYEDEQAINKSEAGTKMREVIREGVPKISVSTYALDEWYQKFRQYKSQDSIEVAYYDPDTLVYETFTAFITNFSCDLQWADVKAEGTSKSLWKISFDIVSY